MAAADLVIVLKLDLNHRIFCQYDLEIRLMISKKKQKKNPKKKQKQGTSFMLC